MTPRKNLVVQDVKVPVEIADPSTLKSEIALPSDLTGALTLVKQLAAAFDALPTVGCDRHVRRRAELDLNRAKQNLHDLQQIAPGFLPPQMAAIHQITQPEIDAVLKTVRNNH